MRYHRHISRNKCNHQSCWRWLILGGSIAMVFVVGTSSSSRYFLTLTSSGSTDRGGQSTTHNMLERIKEKIEKKKFTSTTKEEEKCLWYDVSAAIKTVTDSETMLGDANIIDGIKVPVMVQTNCFERGSLGNQLSNYFEARICAQISGIHYLSLSHLSGEDSKQPHHPFFTGLPTLVQHPSPVASMEIAKLNAKKYCGCGSICHEWTYGLLHRHAYIVKDMFLVALQSYWSTRQGSQFLDLSQSAAAKILIGKDTTIYNGNPTSMSSVENSLPVIPDVAIHYRCGDNTVTHYGFTPFRVFKAKIPSNARHIYVMAESPSRNARADRVERCASIFMALRSYLMSHFSKALVVILQGHDMFDDLARLTYANTTICSVSTYCLWPAMSNNHTVYFPVTKLIAKENTSFDYGPSFHWLTANKYRAIKGSEALYMSHSQLVDKLKAGD